MSYQNIGIYRLPNPWYDSLYPVKDKEKITPQTGTLFFCMFTCGIYKLFNRHDLYELVFRLAITHKHLNVLESFFGDDYLFDFKTENNVYRITTEDLIAHLGLSTTEYPDNENSFENWQKYIRNSWNGAIYLAGMLKLSIPGLEKLVDGVREGAATIEMDQFEKPPTEEILNNARLLAENFIKDIPDEPFEIFTRQNAKSLKEIEDKVAFAKSPLPTNYSWESLTNEAKHGIRGHFARLFDEPIEENATIEDMDQQFRQPLSKLVYLAWIVANDYVYYLASGEFDPRVKIDIFDYQIFESYEGVNLQNVYDNFELEELEPFLKSQEIKNKIFMEGTGS